MEAYRMTWGVLALAAVVAVVLAGRAHSRYLDRQDQAHALNDPYVWISLQANEER
jgi:hypothetical protein